MEPMCALLSFQGSVWFVCKVSSHLFHSPQSHPSRQPLVSCLMKGSPLLDISSGVRQRDKGGCWSNTQTNRQWQKHTFVAQRLALISDSAKSQKEANLSLWTKAVQMRYLSLSLMEIGTLHTSFAIMLHNWYCLHIQQTIEEMVTVQGGAGYPHHWHRTWHWRCWCLLFGTLGLWWADWGPL